MHPLSLFAVNMKKMIFSHDLVHLHFTITSHVLLVCATNKLVIKTRNIREQERTDKQTPTDEQDTQ